MDSYSWLKSQFPRLISDTEEIRRVCSIYEDVHGWSALKLIVLSYYIGVYSNIIPNHFDHMYFVDLFAGCGINRIKKTGDLLAGSPIIAGKFAIKPFDKMFLIEGDPKRRICLNKRLQKLKR